MERNLQHNPPIQLFAPGPVCAGWLVLGMLLLAPHVSPPVLRRVAGLIPLLYAGSLVQAALGARLVRGGVRGGTLGIGLLAAVCAGAGMMAIERVSGESSAAGAAAVLAGSLAVSWHLLVAADEEAARRRGGLWLVANGLATVAGPLIGKEQGTVAGVVSAHAMVHSIAAVLLLVQSWREGPMRGSVDRSRADAVDVIPMGGLFLVLLLLWSARRSLPVPFVLPASYAVFPCLAVVFVGVAPVSAALGRMRLRRERVAGLGALAGVVLAAPAITLSWSLAGGLSSHGLAEWAFFGGLPIIAFGYAGFLALLAGGTEREAVAGAGARGGGGLARISHEIP
ncbi:MAG: hypothetical protein CME06_07035 [Gemmatimonadetes bacterium]|nr:hypothetical protein [Gemmatimonadota bacterium]